MPMTVIPFNMPEPMAIPAHLIEQLRRMPADEAVGYGMELLLQIDAAAAMVYERVDAKGELQLVEVRGPAGPDPDLRARLAADGLHGVPLAEARATLAGQAFARGSSLLMMGQVGAGEEAPLPPALLNHLVGEGGGNVGFLYVLTLADGDRPLGALTLIRAAQEGPLNHEQPNLTQAVRLLLAQILAAD